MKKNLDKSKVKGALYGFAIGDAMGATTEFMTKDEIKTNYGKLDKIIGGGWLRIKPGQVTDDTEMMLIVAESLINSKSHRDYLNRCCKGFADWFNSMPIDVGSKCAKVISECLDKKNYSDWFDISYALDSCYASLGNGGLMRCLLPVLMGNKEYAVSQGKITHYNNISTNCISLYFDIIQLAKKRQKIKYDNCKLKEPTGNVVNTLNNAIYWFLNTNTYKDTIVGAVNDGGDADTIAAICGGIAGTYYGFEDIPEYLIESLDKKVVNKIEEICNYLFTN